MENLVIIGASYLQLPLILKARDMGFRTHVFAWETHDVGEKAADCFYPISIVEKEKILEKCIALKPVGVCSIASDLATVTVNYVAHYLGLTGNSLRATQLSTNKYAMRKAFQTHGDPSPSMMRFDATTDLMSLDLTYPVIVKPTDRSGSRGVCLLTSPRELKRAVVAALDESFEKKALIEQYVEGNEYSVEYISYHAQHRFLALTQKYTTGVPHFIETGHLEPALVASDTLERIKSVVEHALNPLEITDGASHTEIKVDAWGNIQIIEIGARMGGDCIGTHLVPYSTGYDYVKMVIQIACGKKPDFSRVGLPVPVESVFILTKDDLAELQRLQKEAPELIKAIVALEPNRIGNVTNSSNRAGCYIRLAHSF